MPEIKLNSHTIEYDLASSSRRKTVGISVKYPRNVTVKHPPGTDHGTIERLLIEKKEWILKQLSEFDEMDEIPVPKNFVNGERLTYLGRDYELTIKYYNDLEFKFNQGKFHLSLPDKDVKTDSIRQHVINWYRDKALQKLKERIELFAPKVGLNPMDIRVREYKARWGTCQEDDSIDFNWKIIIAPLRIVDYVVVHELCHLVTRDHSKAFVSKLAAIIPDHEKRKKWLDIHGPSLTL